MNVYLLNIGDELLIGQVVNTNAAWMGQQLNLHGARVTNTRVIGDDHEAIKTGIAEALALADVVLITGGLGPTKDDITKKAIAEFFGVGMVFHEPSLERFIKLLEKWGRPLKESHKEQFFMPENALILPNKMGTAPGMWFEHNGKVMVSMPGVPYEMQYLMEYEVIPRLREYFPGLPIAHRTILTVGEGESVIAERIADIESGLPPHIKLAYLPGLGQVRLRLTGSAPDEQALNDTLDIHARAIAERIPEIIFGYGNDTLEAVIGQTLREKGLTMATAESCTGGYIAHLITSVPGSSDYFKGSIVAYANEVKMQQLGVKADTLAAHGAVSEETVIEMVKGAVARLGVDVAIAASGIAGPGGGTTDKPVGTVWLAVGNADKVITRKWQIARDRVKNIQYASVQALNLLRQWLAE